MFLVCVIKFKTTIKLKQNECKLGICSQIALNVDSYLSNLCINNAILNYLWILFKKLLIIYLMM